MKKGRWYMFIYMDGDRKSKGAMKRLGNLYKNVYCIDNLMLADEIARKGKLKQMGVKLHDQNREQNIISLHNMLKDKSYKTSSYHLFTIYEPKERIISRLPYFPDRIVHHAVMNVLENIFVQNFTADTYSCIKGRGIHAAARAVKKALKDAQDTSFCLKMDIKKFYPSVDHNILKHLLCRKFKDQDLLWLLFEIIDSADGLPIGNYLSQYFANFYLSYFDHWLKENKQVRYYFRYADDLVILSHSKNNLHKLLVDISEYLEKNLKLSIKRNHQVFPVSKRGIDFVGYKFFHTHTLLRKSIKKSFAKAIAKGCSKETKAAYLGWTKHADCRHLEKKLLHESV